jgi:hypothetical protein
MPSVLPKRPTLWRPAPLALLAVAAFAALGGLATPARAGDVNLNFYPVSGRTLDKDLWSPVEDQWAFGGTLDFGEKGLPLHMALGIHTGYGAEDFSNSLANDAVSTIAELSVGIAGAWQSKARLRGYVAGGFSFVGALLDVNTFVGSDVNDDDDSLGGWIEAGMAWRLGPHFSLGFGARSLFGTDITLFGVNGNADYFQFGPLLGWSWPARR